MQPSICYCSNTAMLCVRVCVSHKTVTFPSIVQLSTNKVVPARRSHWCVPAAISCPLQGRRTRKIMPLHPCQMTCPGDATLPNSNLHTVLQVLKHHRLISHLQTGRATLPPASAAAAVTNLCPHFGTRVSPACQAAGHRPFNSAVCVYPQHV